MQKGQHSGLLHVLGKMTSVASLPFPPAYQLPYVTSTCMSDDEGCTVQVIREVATLQAHNAVERVAS